VPTALSFIDWIAEALRLIESEELSIHTWQRSDEVLEALVSSVLNIDQTRQGVRTSALLAIDRPGRTVEYTDVKRFCLEYSSQVGVLRSFVLSNGTPDGASREAMDKHNITFIAITGDAPSSPSRETVTGLSELLLGAMSLSDIPRRLEAMEKAIPTATPGENVEELLHSAYLVLLALYAAELDFFTEDGGEHTTVQVSQSGIRTALSPSYAIYSHSVDGRQRTVFLPDPFDTGRGLSLAVTAYELSLRAERTRRAGVLGDLVGRVARGFVSFYLAWADGRCHELDLKQLGAQLKVLIGAPHISIVSSRLHELDPTEQIRMLNLLGLVRAQAADEDLLDSIDLLVPKAQEVCLQTLRRLGNPVDPARLEPFIRSRRDPLRNAALSLVGMAGGDEAATHLIELINTHTVPLSESVLKAIASTRSMLALASLIEFGPTRDDIEPAVLGAIESCLDAVDPTAIRRSGSQYISPAALERYVVFLVGSGADPAKRLALKLIAAFQLAAGVEYVERAVTDESLVTRLHAIRVATRYPSDRIVRAVANCLTDLPEDYEWRKLNAWIIANLAVQQRRDGPAGWIDSVAELDLRAAVLDSLAKADTELAQALLAQLAATSPAAPVEESPDETDVGWRSVPLLNSVYRCPDGLTIWVTHSTRERKADGITLASLIHNNLFEGSLTISEAASMTSGGLSTTQGTETEIFHDVVLPCLRGERPRFPMAAGMGEFVTTKIEEGRTIITGRNDLHDADTADGRD